MAAYFAMMIIRRCTKNDLHELVTMCLALWPETSKADHERHAAMMFSGASGHAAAFLARLEDGEVVGFAEAAVRHDPVNGCETSPVLFLEGIYVDSEHRRKGLASILCDAVQAWGKSVGCTEMGSDALDDNAAGQALHVALGFEERERVVCYRKLL